MQESLSWALLPFLAVRLTEPSSGEMSNELCLNVRASYLDK
jgi:hypothetical protein